MDTATPIADAWTAPPSEDLAAVLDAAVDAARAAVVEFSGETVGEYLGVTHEDTNAATHRFLADVPGYGGWQWAVVVAAYPGSDHATISEVVLVPGPTALLAPQWVPWDQRIRPGDLSPGDLLAPPAEDPRLVPGYVLSGDPAVDDVAAEVGFGRRQVLSEWGRADAAQRWHDGDHGPESAMARGTRRVCRDCGYLLPLAGTLGTMFGAAGYHTAYFGKWHLSRLHDKQRTSFTPEQVRDELQSYGFAEIGTGIAPVAFGNSFGRIPPVVQFVCGTGVVPDSKTNMSTSAVN